MIDCSRWQARNPPSNVSGALFHYAHKKIVSLCAHACVMYARGEMAHKPWNCNHASVCLSSRPPLPVVSAETAAIPPGPQKYTHYICTLLSTWSSRGQLGGAAYRIKFAFSLSVATNIKFGPTLQLFGCVPPHSCERVLILEAEEIWMCQTWKVSVVLTAEMQIVSCRSAFALSLLHDRSSFCFMCSFLPIFSSRYVEKFNWSASSEISQK